MHRLRHAVNRLPVRIRVTLAFTLVMAVLLTAAGLFVSLRLENTLTDTVDHGLWGRASDVSALITADDSGLRDAGRSPLTERSENLAQILDAHGRVVDATPSARAAPLVSPEQLVRARRGTVIADRWAVGGEGERIRVLATPSCC